MSGHVWQLKNRVLAWRERPLLLAVLNVTPDSFSDGGVYFDMEAAVDRALELEAQGADIIDIGGESSRPGAELISATQECLRVLPVVEKLQGRLRIPISIDTWKAEVARRCLEAGAEIVNDISAGRWDGDLLSVVAEARAGYVLMHSGGRPQTMQETANYQDVTAEVMAFLKQRRLVLEEFAIAPERVVLDPGFGFGKKMDHNLTLLQRLPELASLGHPLLVGLSRKSFLKIIGSAEHLEITTQLAQVWSVARGAALWRVHDVPAARRSSHLVEALIRGMEIV